MGAYGWPWAAMRTASGPRTALSIVTGPALRPGNTAGSRELERRDDALGNLPDAPARGGNRKVRNVAVQRFADQHQLLEPHFRIGALQQRPVARAPGPLDLQGDGSFQVHHPAAL